MTVFEKIKSMNIDEFAKWFDDHCMNNTDPVMTWWDSNYCNNCEPEIAESFVLGSTMECAWCESNHKCRFFEDMDDVPDTLHMTRLWLESEHKDETGENK